MKFFAESDFRSDNPHESVPPAHRGEAVRLANAKLEREGKVVWGRNFDPADKDFAWGEKNKQDTHKALLINIESIEKCTHPSEKVKVVYPRDSSIVGSYECECGARVKPKEFEVIE